MWLFLTGTFSSLIALLARFVGTRLAFTAAIITVFIAITGSFKIAIDQAILSLTMNVPTGAFLFGLGLLPDNTSTCLTVMASAYTASIAYNLYRNFNHIQMMQTVR